MEPVTILDIATGGTTVYRSRVCEQGSRRCYLSVFLTSTATGNMRSQINNLPRAEYEKAVAAAAGTTRAEKEAANTTGWRNESFTATDVPTGATVAAGGEIAMDGAGVNRIHANLPPGPLRRRLEYTNASNTGQLTVTRRYV